MFTNTDSSFSISQIVSEIILFVNPSSGCKEGRKLLELGNDYFSNDPMITFINITESFSLAKGIKIIKEIQVY